MQQTTDRDPAETGYDPQISPYCHVRPKNTLVVGCLPDSQDIVPIAASIGVCWSTSIDGPSVVDNELVMVGSGREATDSEVMRSWRNIETGRKI